MMKLLSDAASFIQNMSTVPDSLAPFMASPSPLQSTPYMLVILTPNRIHSSRLPNPFPSCQCIDITSSWFVRSRNGDSRLFIVEDLPVAALADVAQTPGGSRAMNHLPLLLCLPQMYPLPPMHTPISTLLTSPK